MKKPTLLITALLLAVSLGAAAQITSPNSDNISLSPGETAERSFNIKLDNNETGVRIDSKQTGNFTITLNTYPLYQDSDTVDYTLIAPDKGNVTQEIQFTFEVQENNRTEQIVKNYTATTKIPYETLQKPTWINNSYQLNVNGKKFNVSNIATSSIYFNNNNKSLHLEGPRPNQRTVNKVRLTLMEVIPGEYAKIKADTKAQGVQFSTKVLDTTKANQKQQTCKLGIRTITTLKRGSSFAIETVNVNSDNSQVVGGVSVTLIDTGKGQPIGNTQSGPSGYASLYIPEDVKGPVVARLAKSDGSCNSNNQRVSFNKPYNVYIQDNKQFQLRINVQNKTVYGSIKGTVTNENGGSVGTGIVRITKPNGEKTSVAFNKTGFVYNPTQAGKYKLKATKEGYVDSSKITVTYVADRDGDGVPNSQDKCPDTKGIKANNGCKKKEVYFEVYKDGQIYNDKIRPGQTYNIKLVNENRSVVNFTGEIPVEGSQTTLQFRNGVAQQGDTQGVKFASPGSYGLSLNRSAYEPVEQNLQVANKPFLKGVPLVPIGFGLLILLGIGGIAYIASQSGGGSSNTGQENPYGYDLNQLGEDSN